tara:strand:+ start:2571 stop:2984 length:414 start_codon:yes stop_codon:yes gene_type:complete
MSKNPPHRPREMDWNEEKHKKAINLAKKGVTKSMLRVELGIGKDMYHRAINRNEEGKANTMEQHFCESMKEVDDIRQAYWEGELIKGMRGDNEKANTGLFCFSLRNWFRDDYKDREKTVEKQVIIKDGAKEGFGLDN